MFGPVVKKILFKDIAISSYGGHFVKRSRTVCAVLVEGIMWNISMKML